jgi:hypothetical protein
VCTGEVAQRLRMVIAGVGAVRSLDFRVRRWCQIFDAGDQEAMRCLEGFWISFSAAICSFLGILGYSEMAESMSRSPSNIALSLMNSADHMA